MSNPSGENSGITSVRNQRVLAAAALRQRRERDREGKTLIEGERELQTALAAGVLPETVFYCDGLIQQASARALIAQCKKTGAELYAVNEQVFGKLSYRQNPDGIIAVVPAQPHELDVISLTGDPLLVVLVGAEKPGNIGAILRTADAAGASGLILCDGRTDLYNPNVIRASMGTLFTVPVAEAEAAEALEWLQTHDVRIVIASPNSDTPYHQADLKGPVAIVLGAEDVGVPSEWRMAAAASISIPSVGKADSLNLSVATAVILFEAVRQRLG